MANVDELLDLGRKYHEAGQRDHAEKVFRQILDQEPRHAEVLQRMAMLALEGQRSDEGLAWFCRAVEADPANAVIRCNLGAAYCTLGRFDEGRDVLQEAVRLTPDYYPAHYNLGLVYHRQGRIEEATASYRACLQIHGDYHPALRNLGVVLQDLGLAVEARRRFEQVVELQPRDPSSHVNLATVLKDQGDLAGALACFDRALALDPKNADARYRRGQLLVSRGEFAAGWADFEYRVRCPEFDTLRLGEPRWDGSPLEDRTLFVHCEQGLGDTLQFIRYVKLARQCCKRVVVGAQPPLVPLLTESGYGPIVSRDDPQTGFDVQASLLSLPHIFGTEAASIPRDVPYLTVDPARVAAWHDELAHLAGFKVGIAWQGQPQYRQDRQRSIPLAQFAPLATIRGAWLVSLQKGFGSEQLAAAPFEVVDFGDRLDAAGALLDTAALMQSLDLVVTSDTAIAHLAGALGIQVWVALCSAPDWRWMVEGADSPWYPSMRLFRQQQPGDWKSVFDQMAGELARLK